MKILVVNPSASWCGECREDANPNEPAHLTVLGYGDKNGTPGCGAVWTHVGSEYVGDEIRDAARRMRPDLEWTDQLLSRWQR